MPEDLITTEDFCYYYNLDIGFINSLEEHGFISIVSQQGKKFLQHDDLGELEKIMRLHYDLDISFEGLEAILPLLSKIELMQREINLLKRQLLHYRPAVSGSDL